MKKRFTEEQIIGVRANGVDALIDERFVGNRRFAHSSCASASRSGGRTLEHNAAGRRVDVGPMQFHIPLGVGQRVEPMRAIDTVRVRRDEDDPAQPVEQISVEDVTHQRGRITARSVFRQNEYITEIAKRGHIRHNAGKADLAVVQIRAEAERPFNRTLEGFPWNTLGPRSMIAEKSVNATSSRQAAFMLFSQFYLGQGGVHGAAGV